MRSLALALCALLVAGCSIPLPPREAFPDQNADATDGAIGSDTEGTDAADVAVDTQDTVALDADAALDGSDAALDIADSALDSADGVLDGTDATLDAPDSVVDSADSTLDSADAAVDDADAASDGSDATLDAPDSAPDSSDASLDVPDVDLCGNVTCSDLACATQACDGKTGKCVPTAKVDGWPCDDGKKCTANDACSSGVCAGMAKSCDDGNACTNDSCNASLGCVNTVVKAGTSCDDGDACTILDACIATTCVGKAKLFDSLVQNTSDGIAFAISSAPDGFLLGGDTAIAGGSIPRAVRIDASGSVVWDKTYAMGGDYDKITAVAPTSSGFVLVGQTFKTSAPASPTGEDVFVALVDAAGNKTASQIFAIGGEDQATGVAVLDDGFAIAGHTYFQATGTGGPRMLLIRTDAAGQQKWLKTYGGQGDAEAKAILALPDGFALAGWTQPQGLVTFRDFSLMRTDPEGTLLWDKTYGGTDDDEANAVVATDDGFTLAGFTLLGSPNFKSLRIVHTDLSGNLLWNRTYSLSTYDDAVGLTVSGDGYLLAGSVGGGKPNGYVLRTDGNGNKVWDSTLGAGNNVFSGVVGLADGFAFAGYVYPSGPSQMWLLRTDLWGNTTCAASGTCAGFVNDCDDGNPCTADLCGQGKAGCWHVNLADTSPCSSGNTCQVGETCSAGVCGGGGAKLFDEDVPGTTNASGPFAGVVLAPGGFAIGGSSKTGTFDGNARLVRTNAAGTVLWDKTYSLGSYTGYVTALRATAGGFTMAGSVGSDSNSEDCFLLTTDDTGGVLLNVELGGADYETANGLALAPDGYVLAGRTGGATTPSVYDLMLLKTDVTGVQVWQKTFGGGAGKFEATAIAELPDGYIVGGYQELTGAPFCGLLMRTDLSGSKVWSWPNQANCPGTVVALAVLSDGFAALGFTAADGIGLTRTDASGAILWTRSYAAKGQPTALGASSDGFLISGVTDQDFNLRIDADGNTLWQQKVGNLSTSIASLSDGWIIAGQTGGNGFHLTRTDLWGNASCVASGTCAGLNVSDCDDGNPCTADLCDAAHNGCWHTNMTNGIACGYGAVCGAGTCACAPGYVSVTSGDGKVCAADGPVWGNLPFSPASLTDAGDGTVTDSDTGLVWQQANPAGSGVTWDAANQGCIALKLGNASDWRLPTLAELSTLIDFNKSNPATPNVLQTNVTLGYWSATPLANGSGNAWTVSFVIGTEQAAQVTSNNHVRCVRGTTASHAGDRFTLATNTVTDTWTQLIWQRAPDASAETTVSAKGYCDSLALDGSTGWRIPNIVELRSIVDRSVSGPAIDGTVFPATPSEWFWASSGAAGSSVNFWSVYFSEGKSEGNDKVNTFRLRCVK